jgi:hypothetical protein
MHVKAEERNLDGTVVVRNCGSNDSGTLNVSGGTSNSSVQVSKKLAGRRASFLCFGNWAIGRVPSSTLSTLNPPLLLGPCERASGVHLFGKVSAWRDRVAREINFPFGFVFRVVCLVVRKSDQDF